MNKPSRNFDVYFYVYRIVVSQLPLLHVHVQFVFDGRLKPHESFRTRRNEETNVDYDAVSVEIAIL